jgi:hydroxypyruvate isomerase
MSDITRRELIVTTSAALAMGAPRSGAAQQAGGGPGAVKGRLRQSVCRWCYQKIELREFFQGVSKLGLTAVDLLTEKEWLIAKEYGLKCSMGYADAGTIPEGLNNPANHERIVNNLLQTIPKAAKDGVPNLIVFFGNRRGQSDEDGIRESVSALNRVKKAAEDHGVNVCVELLNSKVDHKDYIGDRTPYGVAIMKQVASPRVKLLYDIYHMQIMEGDVIRTIRDNKDYIAHFHTGGVPGRHELDGTQELQWDAIARAILAMGFDGWFAHEFIPTRDPLTSLGEAVKLCDV